MPRPQAIVCHLCNGKFFQRSYPIHLKQCEKKWKLTHSRCKKCGSAIANSDWSDHLQICKRTGGNRLGSKNRDAPLEVPSAHSELVPSAVGKGGKVRECEECETENAVWKCRQCEQFLCVPCETELHRKGARSRHERIPISVSAFSAENYAPPSAELSVPEASEDPRHPCDFCGRKFNPDRVQKHMRICKKNKKETRKRRTWDGSAKRVIGTDFEEFMYRRAPTPPEVLEWRKNGRRWRQEREQFRSLMNLDDEKEQEETSRRSRSKPSTAHSTKRKTPALTPKSTRVARQSGGNTEEKQEHEQEQAPQPNPPKSARHVSSAFSSRFSAKKSTPSKRDGSASQEKAEVPSRKSRQSQREEKEKRQRTLSRGSQGLSGQSMRFSNRSESSSSSSRRSLKNQTSKNPLPPWGSSKSHPARRTTKVTAPPSKRSSHRRSRSSVEKDSSTRKRVVHRRSRSNVEPVRTKGSDCVQEKQVPSVVTEKSRSKSNVAEEEQVNAPAFQAPRSSRRKHVDVRKMKPLLPRGLDLGSTSKPVIADRPMSMEDYREREKIRAQKMLDAHAGLLKENRPVDENVRRKEAGMRNAPVKGKVNSDEDFGKIVPQRKRSMTRVEKRKVIQSEGKVGGNRADKPQSKQDLAAKRAAYFERMFDSEA